LNPKKVYANSITLGEGSRNILVAKVDPDNTTSWKVVEKLGFQRGEVLEEAYERGSDSRLGKSVKRDQVEWYLKRPSVT
jgi:RimJ/RimL family protein N-acetyltransferase